MDVVGYCPSDHIRLPAGKCLENYQEDFVTPGILPASASSRSVIRDTPKRRWKPRGRPLSEQRLRMRTFEELRGSFASFFWAAKNSSSVVVGFARIAFNSARLGACF